MTMQPSSLTHQHLFAIANTLIENTDRTIKILDAGCGDGKLMAFLHYQFSMLYPKSVFEIHGFDVDDCSVQEQGFLSKTKNFLEETIPNVAWQSRIHQITTDQSWPFDEGSFDMIISNQVLEHVHDKPFFFSNVNRTLNDNGYFVALNPLRHCIWEGHIYLPFAHKINSHTSLYRYIYLLSSLGLGKYPSHHKTSQISKQEYSEKHADYVYFLTSYAEEEATLHMAKNAGLRASFDFSLEFYLLKIRQILKLPYKQKYTNKPNIINSLLIKILRYLSSVTLVCQKRNTY